MKKIHRFVVRNWITVYGLGLYLNFVGLALVLTSALPYVMFALGSALMFYTLISSEWEESAK